MSDKLAAGVNQCVLCGHPGSTPADDSDMPPVYQAQPIQVLNNPIVQCGLVAGPPEAEPVDHTFLNRHDLPKGEVWLEESRAAREPAERRIHSSRNLKGLFGLVKPMRPAKFERRASARIERAFADLSLRGR